jgi:LAO/AO transport system kinase
LPTKRFTIEEFELEILKGNTVVLAQAITLAESKRNDDRVEAEKLIERLLSRTGHSMRIGITGAPGVGKSTFIETFGKYLTDSGKKIAVLTIDPTSTKSKGSILGDKTRMDELSKDARAFIRPTASGILLGGVADHTREAILLCEAAGFEVIIIETVGVGQSETAVRNMVDFFLLLMLAGAGDELQGIKKGIMEMADGIVITKADGDNVKHAMQARADFQHALHLFSESDSSWQAPVLTASALEKKGIRETWEMIENYVKVTKLNQFFYNQRIQQDVLSFRENIRQLMQQKMFDSEDIKIKMKQLEELIISKKILPSRAAAEVISSFLDDPI